MLHSTTIYLTLQISFSNTITICPLSVNSPADEFFDPSETIDNAATYGILEPGDVITMPLSDTDWKIGSIQQERSRTWTRTV